MSVQGLQLKVQSSNSGFGFDIYRPVAFINELMEYVVVCYNGRALNQWEGNLLVGLASDVAR